MKERPAIGATPQVNRVYRVVLCSGEQRRWRYLGIQSWRGPCWLDCDSGASFAEASLAYAWEIIGEIDVPAVRRSGLA